MLSQELSGRRWGLGDILDGAWRAFGRAPGAFLGTWALLAAAELLNQFASPDDVGAAVTPGGAMALSLVYGLLTAWAVMAAIWLAGRVAAGEPAGLPPALAASVRAIPRYVATVILACVIVFALGLLLVIPGLVQLVYYTFVLQVVVLRRRGWKAALDDSKALVRGRWWRVLWLVLVLALPMILVTVLVMLWPETTGFRIGLAALYATFTLVFTICLTLLFLNLDALRAPRIAVAAPGIHEGTGAPMKILVLGGGQQGRVIASDLAERMPDARVTVADVRDPGLGGRANLAWQQADCSVPGTLEHLMVGHDLVVGALPSRYGFAAMQAAIAARRNLVDVSFCAEDALQLDAAAREAGVTIVPDAGLAPGISNLVAGEAHARRGPAREIVIMVGGVAQDPSRPYGYCVTWSLDDLTEEYVRPARIVRGGQKVTVPVFSGMEDVEVEGVGRMVAFYSDGLRSLMDTLPGVAEMGEKTLRWPGHVEAVQPLLAAGRLAEELRARCTLDPPEDLVVLLVRMRWENGAEHVTLVDRYDPGTRLTAMARTTAFTTAVTAHMLASGLVPPPGVQPLERVGPDPRAWRFMLDGLADHGVRLERRMI